MLSVLFIGAIVLPSSENPSLSYWFVSLCSGVDWKISAGSLLLIHLAKLQLLVNEDYAIVLCTKSY